MRTAKGWVINQGREKESPTFNKRHQELPGMKFCSPIKSTRASKPTTEKLGVTKGRQERSGAKKASTLCGHKNPPPIPEDEGEIN